MIKEKYGASNGMRKVWKAHEREKCIVIKVKWLSNKNMFNWTKFVDFHFYGLSTKYFVIGYGNSKNNLGIRKLYFYMLELISLNVFKGMCVTEEKSMVKMTAKPTVHS